MWYVIQVLKGREDAMAELIGRIAPADVLKECFSPKYATEMKIRGRWVPCERDLFPGYLVAVTDAPRELEAALMQMPEFARVLSQGGEFIPLEREEVELIGTFTDRGKRVVPMSRAVKEGERVVIVEGPLLGHEGLIREVDRRKSVAVVELDVCGRKLSTRMGLAVVSAPEDPAAKRAELYRREALARA